MNIFYSTNRINMNLINKTLVTIIICLGINVSGQNDVFIPKITPSNPESASLLKYFETTVSPSSGVPDISIPIHNFQKGNIDFPIQLKYNAGGIRINEVSSSVGLGWTLSVPKIVRVVRGIPDDATSGYIYENTYTVQNVKNISDCMSMDPTNQNSCDHEMDDIQLRIRRKSLDLESDIYNVVLPSGKSIQFMFNQNRSSQNPRGEIVTFPKSFEKIEPNYNGQKITSWKITDADGTVYIFGEGDYTISNDSFSHGTLDIPLYNGDKFSHSYINSWNIYQIKNAQGNELNFSYETTLPSTNCHFTNQIKPLIAGNSKTFHSQTNEINKYLSNVSSNFGGSINFIYSDREDYNVGKRIDKIITPTKTVELQYNYKTIPASDIPQSMVYCNKSLYKSYPIENSSPELLQISKRLFLDKVLFKDSNESLIYKYDLEYNEELLPHRFSYAQDWWGFYNGKKENRDLAYSPKSNFWSEIPNRQIDITKTQAGLLKKIKYPTRGFTEYEFENNRGVFVHKGLVLFVSNIIPNIIHEEHNPFDAATAYTQSGGVITYDDVLFSTGTDVLNYHKKSSSDETLYIDFYMEMGLGHSSICDYPPIFNPDGQGNLPEADECYSKFYITDTDTNLLLQEGYIKNGHKREISIPVGNAATGITSKNFKLQVKGFSGSGGTRPETFDPMVEAISLDLKWFVYDPDLVRKVGTFEYEIPIGGLRVKKIQNVDNPIVEGGGTIKEYEYKNDDGIESGEYHVDINFLQVISTAPYVNSMNAFSLQTGGSNVITYQAFREKQKQFNQSNNNNSLDITNKIHFFPGIKGAGCNYNEFPGVSVHQSRSTPCFQHPLNGAIYQTDYEEEKTIFKEFNSHGGVPYNQISLTGVTGIDYSATLLFTDIGWHYDFCSVNCLTNVGTPEFLPIEQFFYYKINQFYDEPVKKITTTNHLNQQDVTEVEETNYNTTYPFLPTETKVTNSLGETVRTEYQYPFDLPSEPYSSNLIAANRISEPLVVKSFNGSNTLSEQKTQFKEFTVSTTPLKKLILPEFVYAKKGSNPLEKKITYNRYDATGNLEQYTLENGTPVSIIWGYNGKYPIAKVEGKTYTEIESLAQILITDSNSSWGLQASNFDNLRNLEGAVVTSYIYKPHIGVTMIIQPNGQKETYEYDTSGRLIHVKDHQGNILKKMDYHYKNQ